MKRLKIQVLKKVVGFCRKVVYSRVTGSEALKLPSFSCLLCGVSTLPSSLVGLRHSAMQLEMLQPPYLHIRSHVYQLPSSGFSTSVNFLFFFFFSKCHRHLLCSDFDIQENIFIFMPHQNLQCISDKAVKCDNKNLLNHGTIVFLSVSALTKVLLSLLILAVLSRLRMVFKRRENSSLYRFGQAGFQGILKNTVY